MTHDSILSRVRATVGAVVVLTLASVGLVAAPIAVQPAAAAAPLACSPDTVYMLSSVSGAAPWTLSQFSQGGTTITPLATLPQTGVLNALGLTSAGIAYYSNESVSSKGSIPNIFRFDPATGTSATYIGSALVDRPSSNYIGIRAAAVNPVNGHYYYAHAVSGDQQWDFYAFNTTTNTPIGFVGRVDVSGLGRVGDIAFDVSGNMYLATSSSSSTYLTYVSAAHLPSTAQPPSTLIPFTARGSMAGKSIDGMAFVPAAGATPLWTMSKTVAGTVIARGTSSTDDSVTVQQGMSGGNAVSDMANCATPQGVLTLAKNISTRYASTDQFRLTISPGGAASATTTGTATGVQNVVARLTSTTAGTTYTLEEVAASGTLSNYTTTLTCTNASTGAAVTVTRVAQGSYTMVYPPNVGGVKANVACQFTNHKNATLVVTKRIQDGRFAASDQFSVAVRTGGATGTIVSPSTNRPTTGVGTQVTSDSGTTGVLSTVTGTSYTITEAATSGSLANYQPRLTCTDAVGIQTGLPNDVTFVPATGYTLTVAPGAQVSCVINNKRSTSTGVGVGLQCKAGEIFGIANTNPAVAAGANGYNQLVSINTSTGAATAVGTALTTTGYAGNGNAIAISEGGLESYYSSQSNITAGGRFPIFVRNTAGVSSLLATMAVPTSLGVQNLARGGINPVDGILWFTLALNAEPDVTHLLAYNTLTGENYGYVGTVTGTVEGSGGDLVFDQFGNMILLSSSGTLTNSSKVTRISGLTAALAAGGPYTSVRPLTNLGITDLTQTFTGIYNGISFDNDGYLWASSVSGTTTSLTRIDPNVGTLSTPITISGLGTGGGAPRLVTDLADCNDPGAISLRKIIDGRVATSDQFRLAITTTNGGNTVDTVGNALGLQDRIAGPIVGVPSKTYTLTETMTAASASLLSAYTTTLECVDVSHGNAVIPVTRDTQGKYTMTFPGVSGADGAVLGNVVCTYTNSPSATVSLTKALDGNRLANSDQFTVQAKVGSATGAAVSGTSGTSATTTGTGSTITAGWGTLSFTAAGGTTYWLGEVGSNGTNLANYPNARITCTDSTGRQSGLPTDALLGTGFTLLPTPGAKIACVITNTVGPAILNTVKTLTQVDGQNVAAGAPVRSGQLLRYTITTTNTGVLSGTTYLVETVPAGTTYVGTGEGWVCEPTTGTAGAECGQSITVARGTPVVKTFTVRVDTPLATTVSSITNTVLSTEGACSDCTVTNPVPAEWTVLKSASVGGTDMRTGQVQPGDTILYTITATAVRGQVTGVQLRDVLTVQASSLAATPTASLVVANAPAVAVTPVVSGLAELSYVFSPAPFTLNAGETATLTYSVTLLSDAWLRTLNNSVHGTGSVAPQTCATVGSTATVCSTSHVTGALLLIEKVGRGLNSDTPLDGAQFQVLSSRSPDVVVTTPPLTATGAVGRFEMRGLLPGSYWLRETVAPTGHTLLAKDVAFTLSQAGVITIAVGNPQVTVENTTIKVTDTKAFTLPQAGGPGRLAFWIGGALLLLIALGLVVWRRRSTRQ